jgi:phage tail sheath protein FI
MAVNPTYPGVYIEEIPSGVRTIRGVATSVAAFIGTFRKGLRDEAVRILSLADFEREFGGLHRDSEASYAVQQFFLNGGSEAWIVRVGHPGPTAGAITAIAAADADLSDTIGGGGILLNAFAGRQIRGESAENPGDWGNFLRIEISHNGNQTGATFNVVVSEVRIERNRTTVAQQETFRNLTMLPNLPNSAVDVINAGSRLIQVTAPGGPFAAPAPRPDPTGTLGGDVDLPAAVGTFDAVEVTIQFGPAPTTDDIGPVQLSIAAATPVPSSFEAWAQMFQSALRSAASEINNLAMRSYLGGATATIVGDGSPANPRRFLIRAGHGPQPFNPDVRLVFGAAGDEATYGLDAASVVFQGPQQIVLDGGADGSIVDPASGSYLVPIEAFRGNPAARTGLYALEDVDLINILCIPDAPRLDDDNARALYTEAITYVTGRRAMAIVDIPDNVLNIDQMQTWLGENAGLRAANAAVYYPRAFIPDPLNRNRSRSFAASGTIAGLCSRTDAQRGVWKAPAGTDARLRNVASLTYTMTDAENGVLNPLGVNCLRTFPIYANICWGARTLEGADQIASDWKYIPIRRTTLFIEESLYRGTQWVVFEPNDEPLWAQIRLNVGAFMHDLFRKGAFQGAMPSDAYFVKCDSETTTQNDIDNGIVNIEVGFAPLKPAEFVILKIQQIAPQLET